ncbi:MAG: hypothetical protein A2Z14_16035 [Chloroflexi bacterium RBG_16_48_8]|nr:MAG: hypothetical protein A2Z14_16035 [Chloroflexi bacterium RBG_16_48_8]
MTLADIPPGMLVRILQMDKLPVEKRDHLLAFGLAPGRWVEIKQHRPAIVVQVDYTELALEPEVARNILVDTPVPLRRMRHLRRGAAAPGRRHGRHAFFHRKRRGRRTRFLSRFMKGYDRKNKKDE